MYNITRTGFGTRRPFYFLLFFGELINMYLKKAVSPALGITEGRDSKLIFVLIRTDVRLQAYYRAPFVSRSAKTPYRLLSSTTCSRVHNSLFPLLVPMEFQNLCFVLEVTDIRVWLCNVWMRNAV